MGIQDLDLLEDRVNQALELIAGLRGEKEKLKETIKRVEAENSALKQTKGEARKRIRDVLKKLSFLQQPTIL